MVLAFYPNSPCISGLTLSLVPHFPSHRITIQRYSPSSSPHTLALASSLSVPPSLSTSLSLSAFHTAASKILLRCSTIASKSISIYSTGIERTHVHEAPRAFEHAPHDRRRRSSSFGLNGTAVRPCPCCKGSPCSGKNSVHSFLIPVAAGPLP